MILESSRTDTDTDEITYELEDNYGGKFEINNQTGSITLSRSLNYEDRSSYNLNIIASDSTGSTKELNHNFHVIDVKYLKSTMHENQKIRSEPTSFLDQIGSSTYLLSLIHI